ncbi:hypothetical protein OPV22_030754 [Ensete ventricosum]|uniref:Josephin-like protein n=1 Tax=Ensete ventricosum TaxID=4639 RepID=A0A426WZ03_ENSVE|nr:hypothetical protein OPV22_030754 [Ensete ventricosum]RRT31972.1 hypothetical protein B296_00057823 [Ensete ventricosum]
MFAPCRGNTTMSKKWNRSAGAGLDDVNEMPTICSTSSVSSRDCEEIKHEGGGGGFSADLAKNVRSTALKFVRLLRNRASKALHSVSGRRRLPPTTTVPSSVTLPGAAAPPDSHLSEAVEDCIKFLHSSSRRSC